MMLPEEVLRSLAIRADSQICCCSYSSPDAGHWAKIEKIWGLRSQISLLY